LTPDSSAAVSVASSVPATPQDSVPATAAGNLSQDDAGSVPGAASAESANAGIDDLLRELARGIITNPLSTAERARLRVILWQLLASDAGINSVLDLMLRADGQALKQLLLLIRYRCRDAGCQDVEIAALSELPVLIQKAIADIALEAGSPRATAALSYYETALGEAAAVPSEGLLAARKTIEEAWTADEDALRQAIDLVTASPGFMDEYLERDVLELARNWRTAPGIVALRFLGMLPIESTTPIFDEVLKSGDESGTRAAVNTLFWRFRRASERGIVPVDPNEHDTILNLLLSGVATGVIAHDTWSIQRTLRIACEMNDIPRARILIEALAAATPDPAERGKIVEIEAGLVEHKSTYELAVMISGVRGR
jgi:hypothetical protein